MIRSNEPFGDIGVAVSDVFALYGGAFEPDVSAQDGDGSHGNDIVPEHCLFIDIEPEIQNGDSRCRPNYGQNQSDALPPCNRDMLVYIHRFMLSVAHYAQINVPFPGISNVQTRRQICILDIFYFQEYGYKQTLNTSPSTPSSS